MIKMQICERKGSMSSLLRSLWPHIYLCAMNRFLTSSHNVISGNVIHLSSALYYFSQTKTVYGKDLLSCIENELTHQNRGYFFPSALSVCYFLVRELLWRKMGSDIGPEIIFYTTNSMFLLFRFFSHGRMWKGWRKEIARTMMSKDPNAGMVMGSPYAGRFRSGEVWQKQGWGIGQLFPDQKADVKSKFYTWMNDRNIFLLYHLNKYLFPLCVQFTIYVPHYSGGQFFPF